MSELLHPFSIGDVPVESNVVLAALAGYSDLAYRRICRELGAPLCMSEMMLDRSLLVKGKRQTRLLCTDREDHPVVGQLIGNDPATMAEAAGVLIEHDYDVVDINLACPVNKARKRKRGGYLMSQPDLAVEITRAVIDAVDRPVTLKVRRSFGRGDDNENFYRIADGVFDAGVAGLCVHARSVEQMYKGPAEWDFLVEVVERYPDRLIIGSGDVRTPEAALDMLQRTSVAAVAAARGALGNPWFFRQVQQLAAGGPVQTPSLAEQREVILRHFRGSVEIYGEQKAAAHMRKFGIRYARMHPTPKKVRMAFVAVKNERQWRAVLDEFYGIEPVAEGLA
jgi:nifR3 family TIM-barrel protein